MVAKSAAFDVAFFQKKPKMNMAKIPGETNPVYSWIYLKPPFSIPRCGAIKIAIAIATTMVYFPVVTSDDSLAEGFIFFWYISSVKMVEMLLAFPARDATMAAVRAAKERPFKPTGNRLSNDGYALSAMSCPFSPNNSP